MNAGVRPRLPLTMSADRAAAIIERGLARGRSRIAFPFVTYMAARLLAALPPTLASRLTARRSQTRHSSGAQPVPGFAGAGVTDGGRSLFLILRHWATLRLCSASVRAKA